MAKINVTCKVNQGNDRKPEDRKAFNQIERMLAEVLDGFGFVGNLRLQPRGKVPGHATGVQFVNVNNAKSIRLKIQPGDNSTAWKFDVWLPDHIKPESIRDALMKDSKKASQKNGDASEVSKVGINDLELTARICSAATRLKPNPTESVYIEVIELELGCTAEEARKAFHVLTREKIIRTYESPVGPQSTYFVDNEAVGSMMMAERSGDIADQPLAPKAVVEAEPSNKDRLRDMASKAMSSAAINTMPPVIDDKGKAVLPNGRMAKPNSMESPPKAEIPKVTPAPVTVTATDETSQAPELQFNGKESQLFTKLQKMAHAYTHANELIQAGRADSNALKAQVDVAKQAVEKLKAELARAQNVLQNAEMSLRTHESRSGEMYRKALETIADPTHQKASQQYRKIMLDMAEMSELL